MAVWELMLTTSTVSGGSGMTAEVDLGRVVNDCCGEEWWDWTCFEH